MAKINQDFDIHKGDHKILIVDLVGEEDIGSVDICWRLGETVRSPAIIEKDAGNGISIDQGTFSITLEPEDTKELEPDIKYYHNAIMVDGMGNVSTIMSGRANVYAVIPC